MSDPRFFKESLFPEASAVLNLGSPERRWLEAYLQNLTVYGRATVPTPVNATDAATRQYVDDRLAILTIEEVDLSPSLTNQNTLRFDQADGFVLTNPSTGVARLDLASVPNSVLANSSVTVTAGGGLSGGGAVALGTAVTISLTAHSHQGAGTDGGVLDAAAITSGTLGVARGGTGITSGTSGGVLGFTAAGTLASSAALTLNGVVIGGGAGATPTATAAGAANDVFRVPGAGGTPGFGTVATAGLADDAVTDAKLRNSAAVSVVGRSAATSGDPADIAAAADNDVLRRSGGTLGFGTLNTASIAAGTLALARGGVNADISAVTTGDLIVGSGAGTMALNTAMTQAQAEAGTDTTVRGVTAQRISQAISALGVTVENRDVVEAEVVNTITETTVYSYSVPGGTFGSDGALRLKLVSLYSNNDGAARNLTVRVKLGATTIFTTGAISITNNASNRNMDLDVFIVAENSTSAQTCTVSFIVGAAGTVTGTGALIDRHITAKNDSTEVSTGALTLAVTIEHGTASANILWRTEVAILEEL